MIAMLDSLGANGFEEKENSLIVYSEPQPEIKSTIEGWLVQNNFNYQFEIIAPQNWNAVWESNFEPLSVAGAVYLRAHFHKPDPSFQYDLLITPKMSFGTGHHATTQLVIKAMLDKHFRGKKVLDFGTGTGVLAILAARMGASSVFAIDNDHWSIENAKENIMVNKVPEIKVSLMETLPEDDHFDIILANINLNVLTNNAVHLYRCLHIGGTLICSGIYVSDIFKLKECMNNAGFALQTTSDLQNWAVWLYPIFAILTQSAHA